MSFVTMPPQLRTLQSVLGGMVLPLGILMIVSMLVLPLPILLLDVFFTFLSYIWRFVGNCELVGSWRVVLRGWRAGDGRLEA